jgi:hypothetical protein
MNGALAPEPLTRRPVILSAAKDLCSPLCPLWSKVFLHGSERDLSIAVEERPFRAA